MSVSANWIPITWRRPEVKFGRNVMKKKQHKNYEDEDKKSAINKKINSQIKKPHLKMIPIKDPLFMFLNLSSLLGYLTYRLINFLNSCSYLLQRCFRLLIWNRKLFVTKISPTTFFLCNIILYVNIYIIYVMDSSFICLSITIYRNQFNP